VRVIEQRACRQPAAAAVVDREALSLASCLQHRCDSAGVRNVAKPSRMIVAIKIRGQDVACVRNAHQGAARQVNVATLAAGSV
jgi:hypothetical protein